MLIFSNRISEFENSHRKTTDQQVEKAKKAVKQQHQNLVAVAPRIVQTRADRKALPRTYFSRSVARSGETPNIKVSSPICPRITVHIRFEKEAKNRKRKAHLSSGNNWNEIMNDLCRSIFQLEISAPSSSAFSGARNSKATVRRVFTPLCENPSCYDSISDKQNAPNPATSFLQNIYQTMAEQALGLTKEFKQNGLPWSGEQCRSIMAGGSGVLFCIPALFCKDNRIEQSLWITQAILSILADYVYIDQDSWFHGIDRIFATSNVVAVIFRAAFQLQAIILITGIIPIGSFILANRSKQRLNVQEWKYYHFLWHLTSSLTAAFVVYLLYNCSDYTQSFPSDNFVMNLYCSKTS